MPELNLPPLHESEAAYYLLAVMMAPDSKAAQREFVAAAHGVPTQWALSRLVKHPERWPGHPELVLNVVDLALELASAPRWEEVVRRLAPQGFKGGRVAGRTLLMVLACAKHAPEHASLGAMIRFWEALSKTHRVRGGSRANLKALWGRFMPVAHLWAAMDFVPEPWAEAGLTGNGSKLAEWLAWAEGLRKRGEAFVPCRADGPLLNPARTWKVPDRFILPPLEQELPLPSREDLRGLGFVRH